MKNKLSTFVVQTLIPLGIAGIFTIIAINLNNQDKAPELFINIIVIGLAASFYLLTLGTFRMYSPAYDEKRDPGSIFTGLAICGIVLSMSIGFGLLAINELNLYYHSKKTTAKIYAIVPKEKEVTKEDEDGNEYKTTEIVCENKITYTVNNKVYEDKLESEKCNKKINDSIKIYYDEKDPSIFRENSRRFLYILMLIVDIPFLFSGIIITKKTLKIKKRRRR